MWTHLPLPFHFANSLNETEYLREKSGLEAGPGPGPGSPSGPLPSTWKAWAGWWLLVQGWGEGSWLPLLLFFSRDTYFWLFQFQITISHLNWASQGPLHRCTWGGYSKQPLFTKGDANVPCKAGHTHTSRSHCPSSPRTRGVHVICHPTWWDGKQWPLFGQWHTQNLVAPQVLS